MKIVAHRGLAPGYKEMTRAAFEHSLSLPIHGVECDVRLCKSGEVVLHHDPRLGRTAPGFSRVSSLTLQQLQRLNFGTSERPETILTLDQMLQLIVDAGDKHLYLEIKKPNRYTLQLEEQIARSLDRAGMLDDDRVHIISFSHKSIRRMAELAPDLDRIYLRRQWEVRTNSGEFLLSSPTGLGVAVSVARLRPELVGEYELPTYMWTANNAGNLAFAERLGVDVVATDYPEMALQALGELASVD